MELPPRARRIHVGRGDHCVAGGTTSACAENTGIAFVIADSVGNYLRVRGEYPWYRSMALRIMELPPRARRIHKNAAEQAKRDGTTSACAENTHSMPRFAKPGKNYLRVRGEYCYPHKPGWYIAELPPRARRIQKRHGHTGLHRGTTSACAENTQERGHALLENKNYLRVRGEYLRLSVPTILPGELPPRARRIP